ncbi:MAG: hypothetical protein RR309_02630 [Cellulosilyticaceae bacterium]
MEDKKQPNFSARDQLRHTKEDSSKTLFDQKHMAEGKAATGLQKFNMQMVRAIRN